MSALRLLSRRDGAPYLHGNGVYLRFPLRRDYRNWSQVREASRNFLEPWEPTWPRNDLTRRAFYRRIGRYERDYSQGTTVPLFLFTASNDQLIGGLNISNIRRAASESCMIGYWMAEHAAGKGLMLEGLNAAIPYIFGTLRLHRIEAACIPENKRSLRLLEKANFQYEGYLRGYLKINGEWRDHHLFALLKDDGPISAETTGSRP